MSWLESLDGELIRPRPHGALVLCGCMSTARLSEHWGYILGGGGLGVDDTVLLDGSDVGVGPQSLDLGRGESTSKAVDDVPLVGDRGGPLNLGECVDVGLTVSTILESDDVSPGNGLPGLVHLEEGRRSRESGENAESENDEALGEHVDVTG